MGGNGHIKIRAGIEDERGEGGKEGRGRGGNEGRRWRRKNKGGG